MPDEDNPIQNVTHGDLDQDTKREVERIREKEQRGEELSMEERGKLGGAARTGSAD